MKSFITLLFSLSLISSYSQFLSPRYLFSGDGKYLLKLDTAKYSRKKGVIFDVSNKRIVDSFIASDLTTNLAIANNSHFFAYIDTSLYLRVYSLKSLKNTKLLQIKKNIKNDDYAGDIRFTSNDKFIDIRYKHLGHLSNHLYVSNYTSPNRVNKIERREIGGYGAVSNPNVDINSWYSSNLVQIDASSEQIIFNLFDIRTDKHIKSFKPKETYNDYADYCPIYDETIKGAKLSHSGDFFLLSQGFKKAYVLSGRDFSLISTFNEKQNIVLAQFSSDEKFIYTVNESNNLKKWDLKTGKLLGSISNKFLPPDKFKKNCPSICQTRDRKYLIYRYIDSSTNGYVERYKYFFFNSNNLEFVKQISGIWLPHFIDDDFMMPTIIKKRKYFVIQNNQNQWNIYNYNNFKLVKTVQEKDVNKTILGYEFKVNKTYILFSDVGMMPPTSEVGSIFHIESNYSIVDCLQNQLK